MKRAILLAACAAVASCATPIQPVSIGGSRADGTVQFSYQYGVFIKPIIDWSQVQREAAQRCGGWGYTRAEPFGGTAQNCISTDAYGNCTAHRYIVTYQCAGSSQL